MLQCGYRAGVMSKTSRNIPNILLRIYRTIFFLLLLAIALIAYSILLTGVFEGHWPVISFIGLWFVTAYVFLPRIHRRLSKIYLPNYFIGRVKTADGLLGDPVNIALNGTQKKLITAMKAAGWTQADDLNWRSTLKMISASVLHKSYPNAPVSSLFLFNRRQDVAFQQEVNNTPHKRHHVRFWGTPSGWWLPGGHRADWLGAATYDRSVGFSALTGQITHKIEEDTDIERDYVVSTLSNARQIDSVTVVEHFTSGYHDRNGGGDQIKTDGSLPFITLKNSTRKHGNKK